MFNHTYNKRNRKQNMLCNDEGKIGPLTYCWSEYTTVQPVEGNLAINSNIKKVFTPISAISL